MYATLIKYLRQLRVPRYATDSSGNVTGLVGAGGTVPLNSAEGYGAAASATAAVNTAAIQAAINAGGMFRITDPGTYLVNDTLTISNDIEIWLGDGVTIKQADGTGKSVLATSTASASDITVSSATSAASVGTYNTSAAHGLAVGDYVLVYGSTVHGFNGVFEVLSIPTATQFTAQLAFAPLITTAAGTMNMRKGVGRVSIYGGTIDWNDAGNNSSGGTNANAVIMAGVHTLNMDRLRVIASEKYAVYVAGCQNVNIGEIDFDTNSDGVHLLGPTHIATIGKLTGLTGDNMLALSTSDGTWTATLPFEGSHDKIIVESGILPTITDASAIRMFGAHAGTDITISAITKARAAVVTTATDHGLNNGELVWFKAVTGMTQIKDQLCVVADVTATTFRCKGINSSSYGTFTAGTVQRVDQFKFHDVTINNITPGYPDGRTGIHMFEMLVETGGLNACVVDILRINCASGSDAIAESVANIKAVQAGVLYIGSLVVNDARVKLPSGGSVGDHNFIGIGASASGSALLIDEIVINNSHIQGRDRDDPARCIYVTGPANVRKIKFNGGWCDSIHSAVNMNNAGYKSIEVYFNNFDFLHCLQGVATAVATKVFANNVTGEDMTYGLLRSSTSGIVIELDAGPIRWVGAAGAKTPIDVVAPATGRASGVHVVADVSTLTAPAIGDIVYNTNAALGTLGVAGLVTYSATSGANKWHLVADPTKLY